MSIDTSKIEQLQLRRQKQVEDLQVAEAQIENQRSEIAQLDKILEAYQFLVSKGVLPVSEKSSELAAQHHAQNQANNGQDPRSNASYVKVQRAIKILDSQDFTLPELKLHLDLGHHTIKRALSRMIDMGLLEVAKEGHKRNPWKYRMIYSE